MGSVLGAVGADQALDRISNEGLGVVMEKLGKDYLTHYENSGGSF